MEIIGGICWGGGLDGVVRGDGAGEGTVEGIVNLINRRWGLVLW